MALSLPLRKSIYVHSHVLVLLSLLLLLAPLYTRQTVGQERSSSPGISLKMSQDDGNPEETLVGSFCHKLSIQGGIGGPERKIRSRRRDE